MYADAKDLSSEESLLEARAFHEAALLEANRRSYFPPFSETENK